MSIKAMTWARDQTVGGGTTKLVLLLLADYANDDGHCWPGTETIAEKAEVNESTVRRHMTTLVRKGFMTRRRKRRSDGTLGVYEYWLAIDDQVACSDPELSGPDVADPPAGKLPTGCADDPENTVTSQKTPRPTMDDETPPVAASAPVVKSPGGGDATSGGKDGHHRAMTHEPPGNDARTTGQSARAEPSGEQLVRPPSSSSSARGARSELEAFLAEDHLEALEAIRELPGWSPRVEETFLARFVTGPTGELLLKEVPAEYRPAIVAECIWQFLEPPGEDAPPPRWHGSRFGGWLRSCGEQARRNVAMAVKATPVGEAAEDGSRELEGGGMLLADGRRLTPTQARALQRVQKNLQARRSA